MNATIPSYGEIHDRNTGIYDAEDQEKIRKANIAVIGQGCVGELESMVLAKIGFCRITISDFDKYEPANMNRNPLARVSVLGVKKADVVEDFVKDCEPYLTLNKIGKVTEENAQAYLAGHDVILQAIDDMPSRVIVHRAARELGIPCVTMSGGPPYRSIVSTFMPDGIDYETAFGLPTKGMSFEDPAKRKEIAKLMINQRAEYAGQHGEDPEWARKFISGERPIWSVTPERAYPCGVDCVHETIKYALGRKYELEKKEKLVTAPDAIVIDKTGAVFKEFGIEIEGIREMVVKDAMTKVPELYKMF